MGWAGLTGAKPAAGDALLTVGLGVADEGTFFAVANFGADVSGPPEVADFAGGGAFFSGFPTGSGLYPLKMSNCTPPGTPACDAGTTRPFSCTCAVSFTR